MKSMTGYGWGECSENGFKITVELSSVNRKQSEISINLPRELEVLEAQIRDQINRAIARGRLSARVSLHAAEGKEGARVHLNRKLAIAYTRELNSLAKELKLTGSVSLDLLLRAPGVLQTNEEMADAEDFWPAVEKGLKQALGMLVKMREREGSHMRKELCHRIDLLRRAVVKIRKQAPTVQERYRQQLIERTKPGGLTNGEIDKERLLKEVFFFADRSDTTKKTTRLESHFKQYDDCLKSKEPVG